MQGRWAWRAFLVATAGLVYAAQAQAADESCACDELRDRLAVHGVVAAIDDERVSLEIVDPVGVETLALQALYVVPLRSCGVPARTELRIAEEVLALVSVESVTACRTRDGCNAECALDLSWPLDECTEVCASGTSEACEAEASRRTHEAIVLPWAEVVDMPVECGISFAP